MALNSKGGKGQTTGVLIRSLAAPKLETLEGPGP